MSIKSVRVNSFWADTQDLRDRFIGMTLGDELSKRLAFDFSRSPTPIPILHVAYDRLSTIVDHDVSRLARHCPLLPRLASG
jgi:hypothetical protein